MILNGFVRNLESMYKTEYKEWNDVGLALDEPFMKASVINNIMMLHTVHGVDISDMCTKGQLISKKWLRDNFPENELVNSPHVLICGGWYGMNAAVLSDKFSGNYSITSIDIDKNTVDRGNALNAEMFREGRYCSLYADMNGYDYRWTDLVINTSCEHVKNLSEWFKQIEDGTMVILQSNNNHSINDHVNCVNSPEELLSQCPLNECLYQGILSLPDYERFMVIGFK